MIFRKCYKLVTILLLMPAIALCLFLPFLPVNVPTHFGFSGTADLNGSKWELLLIAGVCLLILYLALSMRKKDIKTDIEKKALITYVCVSIVLNIIGFGMIYAGHRGIDTFIPMRLIELIPFLIGVVVIVLGVLMFFTKPNFFLGVRTNATLSNEDLWIRTNQISSYIIVLAGGGILLSTILARIHVYNCIVAILILASAVSLAVSIRISKNKK